MTDILKHLDLNSADGTQLNLDALYQTDSTFGIYRST